MIMPARGAIENKPQINADERRFIHRRALRRLHGIKILWNFTKGILHDI